MTKDEIKAKAEMLLKNSRETQGEFVQVYNNGFEDGVNFVLQNLQQTDVSGELVDFSRFLSEEYSIEIHERIIDEWNKYYSANYR